MRTNQEITLRTVQKYIVELETDNAKLRSESAWWAGEGQQDRPEIVEWRTLAKKSNPTPIEKERLHQIGRKIRAENETAPELLERVIKLEADNAKIEAALQWIRALYPDAQMLDDVDDDNKTGCRPACSINTPTIAELRKIDATIQGE